MGSIKGQFLTSPAVVDARESQRVVPGYGFQKADVMSRGAPPPVHSGVGGNTTHATSVQRPATFLEAAKRAQNTPSSGAGTLQTAEGVPAFAPPVPKKERDRGDGEEEDGNIELDPTLPQEMGYDGSPQCLGQIRKSAAT